MSLVIPQLPEDASAKDALVFMREITKAIGPGFHPDSPGDDYVNTDTNAPLFTAAQAALLDDDVARAMTLLESAGRDPYAAAHRVQRRLLRMPFPSSD